MTILSRLSYDITTVNDNIYYYYENKYCRFNFTFMIYI